MSRFAVAGLLPTLLLGAVPEQQEPADSADAKLQDELRATLKTLREERAAYYQRRRSRTEALDAARAPVKRLEVELSELRTHQQEADKNLGEVHAELDKLRKDEAADVFSAALSPA